MSRTLFVACAALGREVKAIVRKHRWDADVHAIDAKLHLYPQKIGPAVDSVLESLGSRYERRVVVYGHCGAFDLDAILEKHDAVRPLGPHCYEMYGGGHFANAIREEPGTYLLTDFLIRAWEPLVIKGLKLDEHPTLKEEMFRHYRRLLYYSQEKDDALLERAHAISRWLELPLEVEHVGYGDLETRLVAIMEGKDQPVSDVTLDDYDQKSYPVATSGPVADAAEARRQRELE